MRIGGEGVGNHAFHNHVRHEIALLDKGLGLFAKLRAGSNLAAEQFSGGDVLEVKLFH